MHCHHKHWFSENFNALRICELPNMSANLFWQFGCLHNILHLSVCQCAYSVFIEEIKDLFVIQPILVCYAPYFIVRRLWLLERYLLLFSVLQLLLTPTHRLLLLMHLKCRMSQRSLCLGTREIKLVQTWQRTCYLLLYHWSLLLGWRLDLRRAILKVW